MYLLEKINTARETIDVFISGNSGSNGLSVFEDKDILKVRKSVREGEILNLKRLDFVRKTEYRQCGEC